jgi:hypothetical protein
MTLVVAHASEDICFMVADTLLSHEHFRLKGDIGPVNSEFHCLKIQILDEGLAIAFAGNFDMAYQAVRQLKDTLTRNPDTDALRWLADQNLCDASFLALTVGEEKKLFVISNGKIRQAINAYIGDAEEYDRYLNLRGPYRGPAMRRSIVEGVVVEDAVTPGEVEFDIVSDAMEAVSRDRVGRKQPSVGAISGCVTRVVDARLSGELEYLQSIEVSNFPWEPTGGFTLLAANTPERGVGVYFRAGGRGFIMPVCGESACIPSYASDLASFIEEAHNKFGMKLVGGTW